MLHVGDYIFHTFVWLRRFRYRRGYGVQSPFAYHVVSEIINGKGQYYAFAPLHRAYVEEHEGTKHLRCGKNMLQLGCICGLGRSPWAEKHYRMLFRLMNFVQPRRALIPASGTNMLRQYMNAACAKADIATFESRRQFETEIQKQPPVGFVLIPSCEDMSTMVDLALRQMPQNGVLVLEDIHYSPVARAVWKNLRSNPHAVLTFDLYYMGIAFLNPKYVKQNYIVNY